MGNFGKSAFYGGIYAKDQHQSASYYWNKKTSFLDFKIISQFCQLQEKFRKNTKFYWENAKKLTFSIKENLTSHIFEKQDLYLPVLVAIILIALVFVSQAASSKTADLTNNLPIKDSYKIKFIETNLKGKTEKICSRKNKEYQKIIAKRESGNNQNELKEKIEIIVKNTPMGVMADSISRKSRPVAAFLVGIAMKESKFGVYSPKLAGRDCYNYWGFKGGGKTVAGGYSCFSSPEEAVETVSGRIEKMVAKGVLNPSQAISWKCGSSCAGHGAESVRKWISDVAIYFNKINS